MSFRNNAFGFGPGSLSPVTGNLDVLGNLHVFGTSQLDGSVTMGSTLSVSGAATFNSLVQCNNNLAVAGNETILGSTSVGTNLSVTGNTTIQGTTSLGGNLQLTNGVDTTVLSLPSGGQILTTNRINYNTTGQNNSFGSAFVNTLAIPLGPTIQSFSSTTGGLGTFGAGTWTSPATGLYYINSSLLNVNLTTTASVGGVICNYFTYNGTTNTIGCGSFDAKNPQVSPSITKGTVAAFCGLLNAGDIISFFTGTDELPVNSISATANYRITIIRIF